MATNTKTTSDEYKRFEDLTKKLVSVPKKDVETQEKKYKAAKSKKLGAPK